MQVRILSIDCVTRYQGVPCFEAAGRTLTGKKVRVLLFGITSEDPDTVHEIQRMMEDAIGRSPEFSHMSVGALTEYTLDDTPEAAAESPEDVGEPPGCTLASGDLLDWLARKVSPRPIQRIPPPPPERGAGPGEGGAE